MDAAQLASDIKKALEEARAEIGDSAVDGGSSNFDALYLPIDSDRPFKRRSKKLDAALSAAGLNFWYSCTRYRKGYVINPSCRYQGSPRTAICKAAEKRLTQWGVSVWYVLD